MKKYLLATGLALVFITSGSIARDLVQKEVPSVIFNNFHKAFPNAYDVEWEWKGGLYKVEFETGIPGRDVEVWYNSSGKITRSREEIAREALPAAILKQLDTRFAGAETDDIKKMTVDTVITYRVDIKTPDGEEWELTWDVAGNMLSKIAD